MRRKGDMRQDEKRERKNKIKGDGKRLEKQKRGDKNKDDIER